MLREELVMLLAKGAIQEVDVGDRKVGVFSHYLLVAKQDGVFVPFWTTGASIVISGP